jgi:hypothetical protein
MFIGFVLARGAALRSLWQEPVLSCPVVIVESDDWGVGPQSDALALQQIAAVLHGVRDSEGRSATMTLGVVLGHPDGPAILQSDCSTYHRTTLAEPRYANILNTIKEGCSTGVFSTQRHGLEHCWPQSLLHRALSDPSLRRWLADPAARSERLPAPLQSRWVDSSNLPTSPLPEAMVAAVISEEARLLKDLFGVHPEVAVPNTFVWDDAVERAWAASGVKCIVTPGCRYEGRGEDGELLPPRRHLRNGECNKWGSVYVVRDAYFEPMRGHRAERVLQAVSIRSALGRPTLLEMHRENFIAGARQLEQSLDELSRALHGVVDAYPSVRFLATEELARQLRDPASPLLLREFWQKVYVFLGRLTGDEQFGRIMRLSGLGNLAGALRGLLRAVKGDPFLARPN